MLLLPLFMIITGLAFIASGLWASHYRSGWMEKMGAILAPFGLIITLAGVLLWCVPQFFTLPG